MTECVLFGQPCQTFIPAAPALAIILSVLSALWIAQRQQRASARANAISIAKNHYKDWLKICVENSDVVFFGTKADSYATLTERPELFRRYRWVFTSGMFALQEVFQTFRQPEMRSQYWLNMVSVNSALFRYHILSEQGLAGPTRQVYDPAFVEYVLEALGRTEHVSAKSSVSDLAVENQPRS
jgi:hypothetical protein